jgi:hypothetical protein
MLHSQHMLSSAIVHICKCVFGLGVCIRGLLSFRFRFMRISLEIKQQSNV